MEKAMEFVYHLVTLNEKVWLGPAYDWETLRDESGGRLKPQPSHYQYVFYFTLAALVLRFFLDRVVFLRLGRLLGVSEKEPRAPPHNAAAEKLFKTTKRPDREQILAVAEEVGWAEQKLQRWLRRRKAAAGGRSKMPKFQEAMWRFTGYTALLVFGFWALHDTDFFLDTRKCWTNYPHETVPIKVFWYYMLELAFYFALTCSHFFDTKRKDFWEMLIHHLATIALIAFSFYVKHVAIGALIMFVHDLADPYLEIAKALGYTRTSKSATGRSWSQTAVEIFFVIFAIVFWITRLYVYPAYLIHSVWVESDEEMGYWPFKYIFLTLLNLLFILHCYWSFLIGKVVTQAFRDGQVGEDSRSDDEGEESQEDRSPLPSPAAETADGDASLVHRRQAHTNGNVH